MSESIYSLRKYVGHSSYTTFNQELIKKKINALNHIVFKPYDDYSSNSHIKAKYFELPKTSYQDLINLLNHFELDLFETEFLSFMALAQSLYLVYNDNSQHENLFKDFLTEKKDFEKLLKSLEHFIYRKKEINSISFKFQTETTNTLNNFFIINDTYQALLEYYNLNDTNFVRRKKELLDEYSNNFNYNNGGQFIVMKIIQSLFDFIKIESPHTSDNDTLRFCGIYLHICQIPSNKNNEDIYVGSIEDSLKLIDQTNLMHLKNGRLKYLL